MSFDEVLMCGSNVAMSPPWATTSSRFCVVWAWAGPAQRGGRGGGRAQRGRALQEFASCESDSYAPPSAIGDAWPAPAVLATARNVRLFSTLRAVLSSVVLGTMSQC